MKNLICILFICLFLIVACENSEISSQNDTNTATDVSLEENSSTTKDSSLETSNSTDEITMENLQIHGFDNIATPEHEWRFKMCETWKKNACVDPVSADCKYWEKSENHMGVTMELCVQAMLITLQQCSQNISFFEKNPRDCTCLEEQYRKTTHKPDLSKKEGPLYAEECFIDEAVDL